MAIATAFTDLVPGGTAGSPKTGDLSPAVTSGHNICFLQIKNVGDEPCNLSCRQTGTTDYSMFEISPGKNQTLVMPLTIARTMEYYFDAGGLQVDVTYSGSTTTLTTATITVIDVGYRIVTLGYSVGSNSNLSAAEVQRCLDDVTPRVEVAAKFSERVASQAPRGDYKNIVLLNGAVAKALYYLRNVGASRGLSSDMVIIANETANGLWAEYQEGISIMESGKNLGA